MPTVGAGDLLDLYSETKALAERAVLAADEPGGLRTVALRPGGLWGPGEDSMMIRSFVEQLASGRFKLLVGDGRALLDNTHVENAVDAHLLAARKLREAPESVGGQAYQTDGEPTNGIACPPRLGHGRVRIPGRASRRRILEGSTLGGPATALTRRGVLNEPRRTF
jgi:3beta-hydroxy-delta5-steroid dehydrogenase/steroid delta-isomerase